MADTGFKVASIGANINDGGNVAWDPQTHTGAPGNFPDALATRSTTGNDGGGGTVLAILSKSGNRTQRMRLRGFGLAVPAGATITGVEFNIRRGSTGTAAVDNIVRLSIDVSGSSADEIGTNQASATPWGTADYDEMLYATYGGDGDLFGAALTPAIVNAASFGLDIKAAANAGSQNLRVDHVQMKVYYTEGGDPEPGPTARPYSFGFIA